MRIFNRVNIIDQSLFTNNITDWTLLIQHPNNMKSNNTDDGNVDGSISGKQPVYKIPYGDQLIPLYCTILGLVIICLIGYIIYKLWKQKSNSLHCTAVVSKGSSGNSLRLPKYSPCKTDNKEMSALVNYVDGVKWANFEQFLMNQPLLSLPDDQIEAIVFSLSDESSGVGWVHLAQLYNVKQEEIEVLVAMNNKNDAIRKFLTKWSDNPNHNLRKLIKSLHEISRPDTAFLIKSSLRKFDPKDFINNGNFIKEANNNHVTCGNQTIDTKVTNT